MTRGLPLMEEALEREFEARLTDSSTLAFRVAFSVLRQREDAEDVAQEAFVKAYRSFARLRNRERFRAWLVRTTWRAALDRLRADRRRQEREHVLPSPRRAQDDRAEQLWEAIEALPEKLRLVVVLASIEGHSIRDLSALLRLPEGTVKSRLFLARQRLREMLSGTR